ncbi:Hypothetical predicted protein, partial [Paramuricea clavata]
KIFLRTPALCSNHLPGVRKKTTPCLISLKMPQLTKDQRCRERGTYGHLPDHYFEFSEGANQLMVWVGLARTGMICGGSKTALALDQQPRNLRQLREAIVSARESLDQQMIQNAFDARIKIINKNEHQHLFDSPIKLLQSFNNYANHIWKIRQGELSYSFTNAKRSIKYWPDIFLFWISKFAQYIKDKQCSTMPCLAEFNPGVEISTLAEFNPGVENAPFVFIDSGGKRREIDLPPIYLWYAKYICQLRHIFEIMHNIRGCLYGRAYPGFNKERARTQLALTIRGLDTKLCRCKSFSSFSRMKCNKLFTLTQLKIFSLLCQSEKFVTLLRNEMNKPRISNLFYTISFISGYFFMNTFPINDGVKQGCVVAPILFILFFGAMLKDCLDGNDKGIRVNFRTNGGLFNLQRLRAKTNIREQLVRELLFADDCRIFAHSVEDLQSLMDSFTNASRRFDLIISLKNTEVLCQRPPGVLLDKASIIVNDQKLKTTKIFPYLGSTISYDAQLDHEIERRIAKASSSFGRLKDRVWNSHDIKLETKIARSCYINAPHYA